MADPANESVVVVSRFGPHIQHPTPAALAWARRATIVKACDDPSPLAATRSDALLIFRAVLNDWGTQLANPTAFVQTTLARLDNFRGSGRLYVELLNEVPTTETARYIAFAKIVVPQFHGEGLLVVGPNFATGDYNLEDWAEWRSAGWAGLDAIGVHGYWNQINGPTQWNAYRHRTYYDAKLDGRPVIWTECGHDRVRDGDGGVYIGRGGWKQDGLTPAQAARELNDFAASLFPNESAVAFTAGPYASQSNYDLDSVAPLIVSDPVTIMPPIMPVEKPMPEDFTSPNHGGPRSETVGVVIHATLSGKNLTVQEEYESTCNYFQNPAPGGDPNAAVSAHAVAGPGGQRHFPIQSILIGWHCRASNGKWLGIELPKCHVTDQIEPDVLETGAKIVGDWCWEYKIPVQYSTVTGIEEHRNMPTNTDGHQDVGGPFDRSAFLVRVQYYNDLHLQEEDLSDAQKKAVLDDLDFIYAYARVENITKNPAEAQRVIQERAIALKTTLGLNG